MLCFNLKFILKPLKFVCTEQPRLSQSITVTFKSYLKDIHADWFFLCTTQVKSFMMHCGVPKKKLLNNNKKPFKQTNEATS